MVTPSAAVHHRQAVAVDSAVVAPSEEGGKINFNLNVNLNENDKENQNAHDDVGVPDEDEDEKQKRYEKSTLGHWNVCTITDYIIGSADNNSIN